MKVHVGLAVLALLAVSLPPARADKKADEAAIRATIDRLVQAQKRKDKEGVMALLTSDFRITVGPHYEEDRQQAEHGMERDFATTKSTEVKEMKVRKVVVRGDEATSRRLSAPAGSHPRQRRPRS